MANHNLDPTKFRSTFNSLAFGGAMEAAARDYMKEKQAEEEAERNRNKFVEVDLEDLEDDDELEALHRQRIMQLKEEQEKRAEMSSKGHGTYNDIEEQDFLPEVTGSEYVVVHFYHKEFERCRIVDKHLQMLAPKYFDTKFIKISAPDAPFFVHKLQIQVLPCIVMFKNGVAFDRLVGFEELRGKDNFGTHVIEQRLLAAGILFEKKKTEDDSDDEPDDDQKQRSITGRSFAVGSDDEDSDFGDD